MFDDLSERERNILRSIIQQFILTALPVGSRNIAKKYNIGFSPATIRNIMSDLEDSGFIDHPHTSAGRVPTDKGYRLYVDELMEVKALSDKEKSFIKRQLDVQIAETDDLLKVTSGILSNITSHLAFVTYPKLSSSVLEKIQIVSLSSTRILVVITVKSGFVKTITLEMDSEIKPGQIESVQGLLNERLAGLTFSEIKNTCSQRLQDVEETEKPVIRFFLDSVDKIFMDFTQPDKMVITGAKNLIRHPEFEDPEKFQGVIELIEDKDIIIHILDKVGENSRRDIGISIGSENEIVKLREYSFVSKEYNIGEIRGSVGIVGPKRMEYSKIVSIVDYISEILNQLITNTTVK
jgi:heat-inducible transcriptional repressor